MNRTKRQRYRLVRELWKERTVTLLFGLAVAFVIARTALLSVHQFFAAGARSGDVLFELAVAYIGAWIFNLLIVVLPRMRTRDRILYAVVKLISRLSAVGMRMPASMAQGAGQASPTEQIPPDSWFTLIGQQLPLRGEAPLYVPDDETFLRPANWQEWVAAAVNDVEKYNAALMPYLPFLEIELITLINNVVLSNFADRGRVYSRLPVRTDTNMSILARPLRDFVEACVALHVYQENNI
jgi:hypothetical protein